MKHWNTLTNMETQVIRVGEFKVLLDLIARSMDSGVNESEIQTAMYTLLGMIEDINDKLSDNFQTLWNEIRDADNNNTDNKINIDLNQYHHDHNMNDINISYVQGIDVINLGGETYSFNKNPDPWPGIVKDIENYSSKSSK